MKDFKIKKTELIGLLIIILGLSFSFNVFAFQIENLQLDVENDIVLGPGKTELWLDPGEKVTKELMITNRTGRVQKFQVDIEDITGSRDPNTVIVFLGEEKGPYSLKDYLKPEVREFVLEHGQRMILPVEISIPLDAEPGGRYGSVLVKTVPMLTPEQIEKEKAKGQIALVSRLGTVLFIRVKGDVKEQGFFKEFKLVKDKKFYGEGPISFQLLFENNGNVHLTPYGVIEISNLLGRKVDEIELEPWFAMPDSLRLKEVKWERKFLFGKYTALASVNRGYKDIVDQKSISFWVIPWKIILAGLIVAFLAILFFKWLFGHIEIKVKK